MLLVDPLYLPLETFAQLETNGGLALQRGSRFVDLVRPSLLDLIGRELDHRILG
jgi:hypothetical protein